MKIKTQRLKRHTRPKMGNSTNERKIEKKARQAMVEQNLRNDKKVIKSRFNLRYQPHGLERCDTSLSLSFFLFVIVSVFVLFLTLWRWLLKRGEGAWYGGRGGLWARPSYLIEPGHSASNFHLFVLHISVNMILKDHEGYYHSCGYKSIGTLLQTLPFPLLIAKNIFFFNNTPKERQSGHRIRGHHMPQP